MKKKFENENKIFSLSLLIFYLNIAIISKGHKIPNIIKIGNANPYFLFIYF